MMKILSIVFFLLITCSPLWGQVIKHPTVAEDTILTGQYASYASSYIVSLYGDSTKIVGQSFQLASPGTANRLSIRVTNSGNLEACTLYARLGATTNLSSTYISSGSVSLSGLSGPLEINIPMSSASLSSGTTYYFGTWTNCSYSGGVTLAYATGNTYADGDLMGSNSGWPIGGENLGFDLYFKVVNTQ